MADNTKCPDCGALLNPPLDMEVDRTELNTAIYHTDERCLRSQLATEKAAREKAEAIVAKLPVYADTGERFVPGVDPCCVIEFSNVMVGRPEWWRVEGIWRELATFPITTFYSTCAAAESALAAKGASHD